MILSCMPCADTEENHEYSFSEVEQPYQQHSHDTENDLCSPFCICNCCSSQILGYTEVYFIDFPLQFEEIKTQIPTYRSIFASNFYGSIWQPPQIV